MTPARSTNRRLLIAVAALGVVAGVVGIGAAIVGTEDGRRESDRASNADPTPVSSTTSAPPIGEEQPAAPTTAPPTDPPAAEGAAEEEPTEEEEAAIEAQLEAEAAVPRAQAEQIALGQVAGTVDRARISDETGTPVWEVRIEGADGGVDVLVDATTGAVLEVDD